MLKIEIKATIAENKLSEFSKARESLLAKLECINGLKSLASDQFQNHYRIKLLFEDEVLVEDVKQSTWYNYLVGAVEVLGKGNKIEISTIR